MRSAHGGILLCALAALAGCAGPLSTLDPAGPSAAAIARVWWWMLAVATVVAVLVLALWLLGMRPRAEDRQEPPGGHRRWIIGGGIVLPSVAIAALAVFGSPAGLHQLPLAAADAARPLTVHVTAHRWWWEIHYPDSGVRLRDELRLPAGRAVDVHTTSADVIHSFWVPRLGGKLDALPGRTLRVRLQATEPGSFRGQCAEFCGVGHAHMALRVEAMEAAAFDAWLQQQAQAGGGAR